VKNFVPIYWSVAGDGSGGTLAVTFTVTADEGQSFLDSVGMGGAGQSGPTLYYVLLNKAFVTIFCSLSAATLGVTAVNQPMFTTDQELAKTFAVDNPGPSGPWASLSDASDGTWVRNIQRAAAIDAKRAIAGRRGGKVTLPKAILGQILVVEAFLRANCLSFNNRDFCNAADKVHAIALKLANGKITESEAVAQVNIIVQSVA